MRHWALPTLLILLSAICIPACKKPEKPVQNTPGALGQHALLQPDAVEGAAETPAAVFQHPPETNASAQRAASGIEIVNQTQEQQIPLTLLHESTANEGFTRINSGTFSFYMGKNPVTQAEYEKVMSVNPSLFKDGSLPVENVSWYDAIEFCNIRSLQDGLIPAYTIDKNQKDPDNTNENDTVRWLVNWNRNANGYRLPTEAEWEYVYQSNAADDDNNVAINILGNVMEWCWDWTENNQRVVRGGNRTRAGQDIHSVFRGSYTPSDRNFTLGFRLVR